MELTNRELAIGIWLLLIFSVTLLFKDMRRNYLEVSKLFFGSKIQILVQSCLAYTVLWVFVLHCYGLWNFSNLKTTILWFFTFALVEIGPLSKVKDGKDHFKKLLLKLLSLTAWLSVVINFSSFPLKTELILVPLFGFLALLSGLATTQPNSFHVVNFLNKLFAIAGIGLFGWNVVEIWHSPTVFFSIENLQDNGLPVLLSIVFIPCLYFWYLFFIYEHHYIGLHIHLKDKSLTRKTKWLLFLNFKNNREFLNRWRTYYHLKEPKNIEDIRQTIQHIKRIQQKEKNPQLTHPENGWSPFLAAQFLVNEGIKSRDYHWTIDDTWFAGCDLLTFNNGVIPSNLDYFLSGDEDTITRIELILNVYALEDQIEAEAKFRRCAHLLVEAAIGSSDVVTLDFLTILSPFERIIGNYKLQLKKSTWTGKISDGYSLRLEVSILPKSISLVTSNGEKNEIIHT